MRPLLECSLRELGKVAEGPGSKTAYASAPGRRITIRPIGIVMRCMLARENMRARSGCQALVFEVCCKHVKWPLKLANEMTALDNRVRRRRHGTLSGPGNGAGYESSGSDPSGDERSDQMVSGRGDPGHVSAEHEAMAVETRAARLRRTL